MKHNAINNVQHYNDRPSLVLDNNDWPWLANMKHVVHCMNQPSEVPKFWHKLVQQHKQEQQPILDHVPLLEPSELDLELYGYTVQLQMNFGKCILLTMTTKGK